MLALEDLPPLSDTAFAAVIGLVLVFWLAMRVNTVRRAEARRGPDDAAVRAPDWVKRAAAWNGTYPVLAAVAAGLVALLLL